jgi:hypothetical protein
MYHFWKHYTVDTSTILGLFLNGWEASYCLAIENMGDML